MSAVFRGMALKTGLLLVLFAGAPGVWGGIVSSEPSSFCRIASNPRKENHSRRLAGAVGGRSLAFLHHRTSSIDRKRPRAPLVAFVANPITGTDETKATNNSEDYRTLYPPSAHARNGTLRVDSIHELYYEEHGLVVVPEAEDGVGVPPPSSSSAAKTALFLHGGPGAGCYPNHARFFDPDLYRRIVLFDQRGCGRSTPKGETRNNTLVHLVRDCEALRKTLGIERWDVLLGGSWGTTLAIAYAQEFPDRVGGLVLRGVCLLRHPDEVDWLFAKGGGAARMDPAGWTEFEDAVGGAGDAEARRGEGGADRRTLHRYYDCFFAADPVLRLHAARAWMKWEMGVTMTSNSNSSQADNNKDGVKKAGKPPLLVWENNCGWSYRYANNSRISYESDQLTEVPAAEKASQLRQWSSSPVSSSNMPSGIVPTLRPISRDTSLLPASVNVSLPANITKEAAERFVPAQAMLTCFYSVNDRFVMHPWGDLLSERRLDRIRHIPCIAIQGGLDNICPPDTALDLHEAWGEMELRVPLHAGHSMYDPAIASEIVKATDRMAGKDVQ